MVAYHQHQEQVHKHKHNLKEFMPVSAIRQALQKKAAQLKNFATKAGKGAADFAREDIGRPLGEAIGFAVSRPSRERSQRLYQQTQQLLRQRANEARAKGKADVARTLFSRAGRLSRQRSDRLSDVLEQDLSKQKERETKSAARKLLTTALTPLNTTGTLKTLGVGAGLRTIGAGARKLAGRDVDIGGEVARGLSQDLPQAGILNFTDPLSERLIKGLKIPLRGSQGRLARAGIKGGVNIAEDELINRAVEGRGSTPLEIAISGFAGGITEAPGILKDIFGKKIKLNKKTNKIKLKNINLKTAQKRLDNVRDVIKKGIPGKQFMLEFDMDGKLQRQVMSKQDASDWTAYLQNNNIDYKLRDLGRQGGFVGGKQLKLDDIKAKANQLDPEIPLEKIKIEGDQSTKEFATQQFEPEVARTIKQMAEADPDEIYQQARGQIGFEELDKLSDQAKVDIKKIKKGTTLNAEQLDKTSKIVATNTTNLNKLEDQISKIRQTGAEVPVELQAQRDVAAAQTYDSIKKLLGVESEAGRALGAIRKAKQGLEPTLDAAKQLQKWFGDSKKTEELTKRLASFDPNDQLGIFKFVEQVRPTTPIERLESFWYNNILSSPATHVANLLGNLNSTFLKPIETAVASQIDLALTKGGKIIGKNVDRDIFAKQATAELSGAIKGTSDGIRKAVYALRHGVKAGDLGDYNRIQVRPLKGKAGKVLALPSNLLVAGDELFRGMNQTASMYSQATNIAIKEGLKGDDLSKRVAELVSNPTRQMIKKAEDVATDRLFQSSNRTLKGLQYIRDWGIKMPFNAGELKPLKFFLPFIQTMTNVVKFGLERSPVGLASTAWKVATDPTITKAEISEDAAKAFIGSALLIPFAKFALDEKITGPAPRNKTDRDAFYASGRIPWAVKIGDRWINYQKIEPLNTVLSQLATAKQVFDETNEAPTYNKILQVVTSIGRNVADQTFLKQVGDLWNAIEDPERYGSNMVNNLVRGFIPGTSLLSSVARATDPTPRRPQNIKETILSNIPGLSRRVTPIESEFEPGGVAIRKEAPLSRLQPIRNVKVEPGQFDPYENLQRTRQINEQEVKKRQAVKDNVNSFITNIRQLNTIEKRRAFLQNNQEQLQNPEFVRELNRQLKSGSTQQSPMIKTVQAARSNTAKAKAFISTIRNLNSIDQRRQFLIDAQKAGIFTDDFVKKLEAEIRAQKNQI
jgi:hypothetical protein